MIIPQSDEAKFVLHEREIGDKIEYQLTVGNDELQFFSFQRTGNMATISDDPNITRLFGSKSEDTRTEAWLTFQGKAADSEGDDLSGVYRILETGTVKFGEITNDYVEMFFNEPHISGRWILRKIPNILDRTLFSDEEIFLLWKPPVQRTSKNEEFKEIKCDCPVKTLSAKFSDITKEEGEETISKLQTDVLFDSDNNTFNGIGAAEGTWTDMYGERYVYTKEFITHIYNQQRDKLKKGEPIVVGTQHGMMQSFDGEVNDVQLFTEPIYHIRVKGIYNGPSDIERDQYGLSYEFRFKSVWNPEFQSWVPFEAKTDRIDVVARPACKVCWINKVNEQEND